MSAINYDESVRLIRLGSPVTEVSLAEAVRSIMSLSDVRDRALASILWDGELIMLTEIEAIYCRRDFPKVT